MNMRRSVRLTLAAFVGICTPWLILSYPFVSVSFVTVGEHPHGVISGDFNGDGKVDLVSTNTSTNSVSFLGGNGDGTFQPKVDYPVQTRPKFSDVGDFNGDGKLDIITANEGSDSVTVLPGNGNGTFQTGIHSPAGCSSPHEVFAADIDKDGRMDAVVPCWNGSTVGVLFGAGTGSFQTPIPLVSGSGPHSAVVADFNKDGRNDIAVANGWGNTMTVLLATGPRTFSTGVVYATGVLPHSIRTADLNKDGNPDLFTANDGSNQVSVFLGNGMGAFAGAVNYATGLQPESVVAGDVNGDGSLDLLTANSVGGNVSVLLGNGTGGFAAPVNFGTGTTPFHAILAYLDGDTVLDIATANYGASDIGILLTFNPNTLPPGTTYLSERVWLSATNGWGPVELDTSNGESSRGDGAPLRLNGITYARGIGVHAASEIRYAVQGCSSFSARVGVDDEVGNAGSVVFQVWGDATKLFDSGTVTGASATQLASVSLTGRSELRLIVLDGGDGPNYDHADWADALITCAADITPPTVTATTPGANATNVSGSTAVTARFSEPMLVSTVNSTTLLLVRQSTATTIPATITYDINSSTATLTPASPLQNGQVYIATVKGGSSGVADAFGNRMTADVNWSFTISTSSGLYLSDRAWIAATNGWGPVEIDKSNGETAAGDGRALAVNGTTYAKGLGVHAPSDVRYSIVGCSTFTALVGVDDEVGSLGSVVFQVFIDGNKVYESPPQTGLGSAQPVSVTISGGAQLRLVVTDAGDGNAYDHANWLNPQIVCAADSTPPAVSSAIPVAGASNEPVSGAVRATFSEALNASTINATTFSLTRQGTTTPVAASVIWDAGSFTAWLAPSVRLAAGATYTAVLRGGASGVKDVAGNALPSDYTWTFSTSTGTVTYLSDRPWASASNGWGPAEPDKSNGENSPGDGAAITIGGTVYAKGLGVHALSDIRYTLGGCSSFTARVGVDAEVGMRGSVVFQVFVDGTPAFDSGTLSGSGAAKFVNVSLTGRSQLRLVVTDAGDGPDYDHGDWADAQLTCN